MEFVQGPIAQLQQGGFVLFSAVAVVPGTPLPGLPLLSDVVVVLENPLAGLPLLSDVAVVPRVPPLGLPGLGLPGLPGLLLLRRRRLLAPVFGAERSTGLDRVDGVPVEAANVLEPLGIDLQVLASAGFGVFYLPLQSFPIR